MKTLLDKLYLQLQTSPDQIAEYLTDDVQWHVSAPINNLHSKQQMIEKFWQPLASALPDIERKPFINIESEYNGATWVASTGYFIGTFTRDLFDIPATNRPLYLRYTELVKLEDNKIAKCYNSS